MKSDKAARALEHLDDDLILSAMKPSDLEGERTRVILGRRKNMARNFGFKRSPVVAAVLAIVIAVGIFGGFLIAGMGSGATVAFDVNPSIELEIDRKERVSEIVPLNAEAVTVIGDMNLVGVDLDVAVNAIIGSMVTNGYLSTETNSILVSVNAKNTSESNSLKAKISEKISALLGKSDIDASVIVQDYENSAEIERIAKENGISEAKASLISKITAYGLEDAKGVPYSFETLAGLNVNELKLILESKSVSVSGISSTGTASGGKYIGEENAYIKALEHAGITESEVIFKTVEMDFEEEIMAMVYEVDFIVGDMEYEYEIRAKNGEILYYESEPKGSDDDNPSVPPENIISKEAALAAAYADAGITASEAKRPEIELDVDDGKYVYEIEFKTGIFGIKEHEYKIDAVTGRILERD